jgi:radical SAM enzyme (TIGR01210 family)
MCGYFNDSMWEKVADINMLNQLNISLDNYSNEKFVKIFTSGSFFDDNEIKPLIRIKVLKKLAELADRISVESRPEFITDEKLAAIKDIFQNKTFEISIGLETANDFVREHAINKGFLFDNYKKAVQIIKSYNFKLKTYVLIKPPFLTESEAIEDCLYTFSKIKNYSDTISFNPTNVQRNTVVEFLWKRNQYRPPWLWSIVEILKTCKSEKNSTIIKCDIAGGGNKRGAHNCKNCNNDFLSKVADFSLHQDENIFNNLDCECREKWLDQIDIENLTFGSIIDFSGRYI